MPVKHEGAEETRWSIGLMSGTSLDGIDVAAIRTDGVTVFERGPARVYAYDAAFQRRLAAGLETAKALTRREARIGDLEALEVALTDRHASAVETFLGDTGLAREEIDVVGFHGQTVLHRPDRALTVQIGDGQRLADALGLSVVHDMRAADMMAGGQGAPLVPAYHQALVSALAPDLAARPVVFVNIGGISNVTWLGESLDPVAFDSGPGNALIDRWVQTEIGIPFDQNGHIASEGGVIEDLAGRYLSSEFFARAAPKSLDRFDFPMPDASAGSVEDVARTLCFVSAEAILKSAEHFPSAPKLWIACGGGRRHPAILADLKAGAARRGARVVTAEEAGFDGDAMEAEAWAFLAKRSLAGLPLTYPTTTGCRTAVTGGVASRPGPPKAVAAG
ncbi:anhydro-N-acetylmuramic acid kinase [Aurantimonas sp. Leaf443]|uniref:anhydro-N-acetylmuramic acid kinase n=1 Tax=Aurantimonas sp. Leaf443 TaxID=1736378 RepID=UPI0006FB2218|nr:anhydro-N-acetylmuramic acid kinase [Aurantimonas sp. Leaf443]KQT83526.1 anhydro-N-acetylmuramic acid kinase [Aurantimonas sp. Leaf443]